MTDSTAATPAKIAGDTRRLLLSSVWSRLAGALIGLVSARVLGPSDFGILRIVALVPSLAKFGSFGFDGVAEREIAHLRGAGGSRDEERRIKDTAFTADLLWVLLLAVLILGVAQLTERAEVRYCLWIATGSLAAGQVVRLFGVVSAVAKRFGLMAQAAAVAATVEAVCVLSTIHWGRMYSVLGGSLVGAAAGIAWYRRSVRLGFSLRIERLELLRQLKIALPLAGGTVAFGTFAWIERLEVVALFGSGLLGIYMLSVIAYELGLMFHDAILRASSIHLFEQLGSQHNSRRATELVVSQSLILAYSFPLLGGLLFLVGPPVVAWLLPQYLEVVSLLPWIGLMLTFRGLAAMSMTAMNSARLNMQKHFMLVWFGASALFAATTYLAARLQLGIDGVAAAKSLSFLAMALAAHKLTYRFFFDSRGQLLSFLTKAAAPLLAAGALLWALSSLLPATDPAAALVKSLLFIIGYLPLLIYLESQTRFLALILGRDSDPGEAAR